MRRAADLAGVAMLWLSPLVAGACGGGTPAASSPPATALPVTSTAKVAPNANADPTTLADAQKARDAARMPLAKAVTGAYPNWNGFFSTLVATWSPDGTHIVFGSQRDGIPEIYEGDVAKRSDAPRAVTTGPERAIWATYSGDGKSILFLRDEKGDENHHIYRVAVDGTGLVDLTPGEPMQRDEPITPRAKPDTIIYGARRVTDTTSTYFAASVAKGGPKVIYTHPRPSSLSDVTADGARGLLTEYPSTDSLVLSELDFTSGKTRRLFPAEGKKVTIFGSQYSPDGSRIYVASDDGAESSILVALDTKTGKEVARYVNETPATAPLSLHVSPKGDRVVVGVAIGNRGEVRVLDGKTLKLEREIKVPLGDVEVGSFRRDGKEFSLLVSLPDAPPDVYAANVATGEIRPLREEARPGLDALPKVDATIENVKAFDGLSIPLNQYLPRDRAGKKLPTIAMFHGGPASSSAVRWNPYARFFLSLGYAVVEPNVRGSTGFGRAYEMGDNREKRADWLKDVEAVNAWVKVQPWCDPERVVVWGQSYGGYTTLMALTRQPTLWRAGVDLYGPADLKQFLRSTDSVIRMLFVSEFGDVDNDGPLLDQFSPMRDIDKIAVPLFVYAGKNDPRVPLAESDSVVRALRSRRVPVEYMVAANEGHTVDRRETKTELLVRTSRFLEDALTAR